MANMLKKGKKKNIRMKQGEIWKVVETSAISFTDSGDFKNPSGRMITMRTIAVLRDDGDFYRIMPLDARGIGFSPIETIGLCYTHKEFAKYYSQGKIKRIK